MVFRYYVQIKTIRFDLTMHVPCRVQNIPDTALKYNVFTISVEFILFCEFDGI